MADLQEMVGALELPGALELFDILTRAHATTIRGFRLAGPVWLPDGDSGIRSQIAGTPFRQYCPIG